MRRLVSSDSGALARVLFALPRYAFQSGYERVFADLWRQLPARVEIVVLVHASVRARLRAPRATIVEIPDDIAFSTWIEDVFALVHDGDEPILAAPASLRRVDDARLLEHVQRATGYRVERTRLYFEGGNLLVGDDFCLIGADHPRQAVRLGLIAPDEIGNAYEALDGERTFHLVGTRAPVPPQQERVLPNDWREVLHAGNIDPTVQPTFHLDMCVTLAGHDRDGRAIALVGDPRLAAALLDEPLREHAMADAFDEIAAQLEALGMRVVRNPLPLRCDDDRELRRRQWYFASSNNALVEVTDERHVWLPTYGEALAITDAANRRVWEQLGFTVHALADCTALAVALGGVHCLTKVLARTAHPSGDCRSGPARPRS